MRMRSRFAPAALAILATAASCGRSSTRPHAPTTHAATSTSSQPPPVPETIDSAGISGTLCLAEHTTCWATTNDARTHGSGVVRSDDGGSTWREAHVPLPAPFAPDLGSRARMLFVDGNDVVIELDRPTGLFYAVAFVASRDGGRRFTTRPWPDNAEFPDPNGTGAPFLAAVHDAEHWTVVLDDATNQSDDAGGTWHRFALPAGLVARGASWSTIDTGSIVATTPDGRAQGLHTTDGGKSWVGSSR